MLKNIINLLQGNLSTDEIERWGHEYVRHLAGEVVSAFNDLTEETGWFTAV